MAIRPEIMQHLWVLGIFRRLRYIVMRSDFSINWLIWKDFQPICIINFIVVP